MSQYRTILGTFKFNCQSNHCIYYCDYSNSHLQTLATTIKTSPVTYMHVRTACYTPAITYTWVDSTILAGASGGKTSTKIFKESFLDLEVGAAASRTLSRAIMYCGRLGRRER